MKYSKIDKTLFFGISAQNTEAKIRCFVLANDFFEAKKGVLANKIQILDEYLFIKIFYCLATKSQILSISDYAEVAYISSSQEASSLMYISRKILGVERSNLSGAGVGVAFIDTGIEPHADFVLGENRVYGFVDFINGRKFCYDDNGHGTFVCGVCSGNGALSAKNYCGIAPRSRIFSLKALNKNGEAGANKILSAMEWVYNNHVKNGIKVVCMSFGSEPLGKNDPIMIGAEALWNDGVVVVSAAGNSGPQVQTIKSPGVSAKIITTGGIDDNRFDLKSFNRDYFEIANFSSRGPSFNRVKPDVVAPSVDVLSCGRQWDYRSLSGTSVATPMIAGICALMFEKYPFSTPTQIKNALIKISRPLGFDKNFEGYGLPNVENFFI